jgi:hypothetical protein
MEAVQEGLIGQALATAVLDKSSPELQEALLAVLWERKREELLQQALEQVREEQRGTLEALEERLRGRMAQARRDMEREADEVIQQGIHQGLANEREDFAERRQRLIRQRNEWKARASDAEAWITSHIQELLPAGRRVLLRGPEITKFRLHSLNLILSRLGFEVKAQLTDTMEIVACEVGPQHWEQKSRFRLVTVVSGVVDETDDDEPAAVPEASADGATIN